MDKWARLSKTFSKEYSKIFKRQQDELIASMLHGEKDPYWDKPSYSATQKYFAGFGRLKDCRPNKLIYRQYGEKQMDHMYEEELKDVEKAYRNTLQEIKEGLEDNLPYFLSCMETFLDLNKKQEIISDKLEELLDKNDRLSKDEHVMKVVLDKSNQCC